MSIATKLEEYEALVERNEAAKESIASAITAKGGTVTSGDGFADFAADIESIPSGSPSLANVEVYVLDFSNDEIVLEAGALATFGEYITT